MASGMRNVYVSFVFIAMGGLLFGYIIGITSNVVTSGQLLCPEHWVGSVGTWTSSGYNQCYNLDPLQQGALSSLNLIGALISSLICFRFADDLGRKLEVQIGAVMFAIGAGVAAASPVLWGIYLGFTVYGLGIGFAMHAAPVYIAEISPANIRGTLVSAKEAVVVTGIFLGFLAGYVFSNTPVYGWRYTVGLSALFAIIMGIGISCVPQSPRFLVLRAVRRGGLLGIDANIRSEALSALKFFRQGGSEEIIESELDTMCKEITESVGNRPGKVLDTFNYPYPLLIGCGLVFLQQVTGQPSVLYFATNIFKGAGFGSSAALSSVGVGLVKLLATLFTVWRVDQYGRRLLLFAGLMMMAVALAVIGTAFLFRECQSGASLADCDEEDITLPQQWAVATVAALMLYVSGYQVGFGPISWLMISEVFPLSVRGAAMSLAAVVNFGSNIGVTLTQKVLQNALTPAGVFFAYLALTIASLFFVQFVVPETKGKTLEEIEEMITKRKTSAREVCNDVAMGA